MDSARIKTDGFCVTLCEFLCYHDKSYTFKISTSKILNLKYRLLCRNGVDDLTAEGW